VLKSYVLKHESSKTFNESNAEGFSTQDDYGSVIPLKDLELNIPADESVIQTLKSSSYAAIFTEGNIEDNGSTIILASGYFFIM
jgi:hypothetical protein